MNTRIIRKSAIQLCLTILFSILLGMTVLAQDSTKTIDVMFTHDLHSHMDSFATVVDGESVSVGGFARIHTLIKEQKQKNPDTLIVDGGDFAMGTLYQTIYENEAPELRMFGLMGYDVVTVGNHEFDYQSNGLHNMLEAAVASKDPLPAFVVSNVDWDNSTSDGARLVKESFDDYGITDYVLVQKGDVKIAVMGIFGTDALAVAPTCELAFKDPIEGAKETVSKIKANEDVDMIVCLSHSGTDKDETKSEDQQLAKKVPEIDLIVSGHTHSILEEPLVEGDTSIVSSGEYGKKIGKMSMQQTKSGRWEVAEYELIPITEEIPADTDAVNKIDEFGSNVDQDYLQQFDYSREEVLAYNSYEFSEVDDVYEEHVEHTLGNLMADGFAYGVNTLGDEDNHPVDVAVIPSGVIRDTYAVGNITVDSVFNSFSLGIGLDGVVGYPLVSAYLTGEELKTVVEFDASISDLMTSGRLYLSGVSFTYNPNRIILNRVTDCYLNTDDGKRVEIEDDKLYRVIFDYYTGQMMDSMSEQSAGLLQIAPKDADGNVIEDFDTAIVYQNGKELKAWQAIAAYMESFEENEDGIPQIPEKYSAPEGRKVVDESTDLKSRFSHPNKYVALYVGILVFMTGLAVILILVIRRIARRCKKKSTK